MLLLLEKIIVVLCENHTTVSKPLSTQNWGIWMLKLWYMQSIRWCIYLDWSTGQMYM